MSLGDNDFEDINDVEEEELNNYIKDMKNKGSVGAYRRYQEKKLKTKEDDDVLNNQEQDNNGIAATGGNVKPLKPTKQTKQTKQTKPTKPTITGKKEILGKQRCIYKKAGDRKEYVKYKGDLITVKDYKKIISVKKIKK